ncbi:hypothetical protein ZIOFF_057388 [Zingiber officinale]|uniref:Uncharacterized protein n=1 Tax=Zingiber officinale TaxID=94328 RepID=A0A8J5F9I6_ZINOF|nr:hypothetical protein ZIOFF_057388 [Zingiber officinale]
MQDCLKRGKLTTLVAEQDHEANEEGPSQVNPLQLLGALHAEKSNNHKSLMLDLDLSPQASHIKVVNSEAKPIKGVTNVKLQVGSWSKLCGLMVVPFDDFDIILGNEFLVMPHVAVMPHPGSLLIVDETIPHSCKASMM